MWFRTLLPALAFAVTGFAAQAEEYVKSFRADIEIARTGELKITETITINAEGKEFKHGIFRDFPMDHMTSDGMQRGGLELLEVTRDGTPEEHRPGLVADGRRIYIGRKDTLLPIGEHTYRIVYRLGNQIRPAGENDVFAWNVTGSWPSRIDHAEARVTLPNGTRILGTQQNAGAPDMSFDNAGLRVEGTTLVFSSVLPIQPKGALRLKILIPRDAVERPH